MKILQVDIPITDAQVKESMLKTDNLLEELSGKLHKQDIQQALDLYDEYKNNYIKVKLK